MSYLENKSYSEKISEWEWLKDKQVFVACSGGVDSIVLIHLLLELQVKVEVLHVNYQLREEESLLDQNFVASLCHQLGVPFHLKVIPTKVILKQNKQNLQQFARDQRYGWFQAIQSQNPSSYIALGHHSDDQIETFFLQFARKSGVMGLSGMLQKNGVFIRPLLRFSKEELYSIATNENLNWREDSSNHSLKYSRNKLRNEILPLVYSKIPTLKESILFLMDQFQSTQLELEKNVQDGVAKIKAQNQWLFSDFDKLTSEELIEVLRKLRIGGNQIFELKKMRFAQKGARRIFGEYEFIHEGGSFSVNDGQLPIEYILNVTNVDNIPTVFDKSIVYFDPSKVDGDLQLRSWKKGDRMKKIGMKGTTLISDVLTDAKIPHSKRNGWPVVFDSSGILWCYRCAISEKAIAKSDAKTVWKLELIERKL